METVPIVIGLTLWPSSYICTLDHKSLLKNPASSNMIPIIIQSMSGESVSWNKSSTVSESHKTQTTRLPLFARKCTHLEHARRHIWPAEHVFLVPEPWLRDGRCHPCCPRGHSRPPCWDHCRMLLAHLDTWRASYEVSSDIIQSAGHWSFSDVLDLEVIFL